MKRTTLVNDTDYLIEKIVSEHTGQVRWVCSNHKTEQMTSYYELPIEIIEIIRDSKINKIIQ